MSGFVLTPLLACFFGYLSGILLAGVLPVVSSFPLYLILFLAFIVGGVLLYFVFQERPLTWSLVTFFVAFGFYGIYHTQKYSAREASIIIPPESEEIELMGTVVSFPERSSGRLQFVLASTGVRDEKRPQIKGKIQVFVYYPGELVVEYGDRVTAKGKLFAVPPARGPVFLDHRTYLKRRGIFFTFYVYGAEKVQRIERPGFLSQMILSIRRKIEHVLESTLPAMQCSVLKAVMLGDRSGLTEEVKGIFASAGVLHTLAVSGLHVGLVLFVFFLFFRCMKFPEKLTCGLSIVVVFIYALVTGARPSAIRATIMATCALVGFLLGRETYLWNSLGLSGLIILILNPFTLFDIGFQLSYMATAGILYLNPYFLSLFPLGKIKRGLLYILGSFGVSLGASIGVYPIVAFYFNRVSLIAPLANIIIVPLVGVVIGLGFASSILGIFYLFLARFLTLINAYLIDLFVTLVRFFAELSFSARTVESPSLIRILFYYSFFGLLPKTRTNLLVRWLCPIFLVLFVFLPDASKLLFRERLEAVFLDVGHGDAIHLVLPGQSNILIDGGGVLGKPDIGENILVPYLLKRRASNLDAVFLTHPHYNHIGGLVSVLKACRVRKVYYNGENAVDDKVAEFYEIVKVKKIPLKRIACGDQLRFGKVVFSILNPSTMSKDIDANSLAMRLVYEKFRIFFSSDIPYDVQEKISASEIESDILQLPNHGRASLSKRFLYKVNPEYVIISGKPKAMPEALGPRKFFSTGHNGTITITTDGKSYSIKTSKEGPDEKLDSDKDRREIVKK